MAFKVFGCTGTTDFASDAIDMALDPDGDGSIADAVDEIVAVLGLDDASLPLEADVDVAAVGAEYGVSGTADEVIAGLISRRETARSERDFATADAIRDALDHVGIMLEDGPDGTRWLRK